MASLSYTVIIGDMVASRNIAQRDKAQKLFHEVLKSCNRVFKKQLVSPLTLTIGDEFQAVLKSAHTFPELLNNFEQQLNERQAELRFRYGIGRGEISTAINSKAALAMDGPAFHRARAALESAKKENLKYCFRDKRPGPNETQINLLLKWIGLHENQWSAKKQNAVYYSILNWTQKKIAVKLDVSQPAVSQLLKDPATDLVWESKALLKTLLNGSHL